MYTKTLHTTYDHLVRYKDASDQTYPSHPILPCKTFTVENVFRIDSPEWVKGFAEFTFWILNAMEADYAVASKIFGAHG